MDLYNRYGLYVICEADQENHDCYMFEGEGNIVHHQKWEKAFVDRATRIIDAAISIHKDREIRWTAAG